MTPPSLCPGSEIGCTAALRCSPSSCPSWYCAHDARTRRSECGCRVQTPEREITGPQHGDGGQKKGYQFETGPTRCKMSEVERSLTLDVVKDSLWVDVKAYTTARGARNADARFVAPLVGKLTVEQSSRSCLPHPVSRKLAPLVGHQLNT